MRHDTDARGRSCGAHLAALGASRQWVLGIEELHEAGWSERRIRSAVARGLLFRVYRTVYAVGRPELSLLGWCRAGWLAAGPGAAVSHISAAAVWGFRQSTGAVHVSVPLNRRRQPWLIVHRPRALAVADIVDHEAGFAVTSVARTLLDVSEGQSVDTVGRWMHEAEVQRVLDLREVLEVLGRSRQHRGRGVLEAALAAEVVDTRTRLEEVVLGLWRRAGLPEPRANEYVWSSEKLEEVDLVSRELGLIVEADGTAVHASRWRRRKDAEKTDRLRAAGWMVVRVPELRATLEPDAVVAEIRAAASLASRERPRRSVS